MGPAVRSNATCVALRSTALSRSCPHFICVLGRSMQRSPSWEAYSFSSSQEILYFTRNPKTHWRLHNSPSTFSIVQHVNQVHTLLFMFRSSKWTLLFIFLTWQSVCIYLLPHTCYIPHLSHHSWFYHRNDIWWPAQTIQLITVMFHLACSHLPPSVVTMSCQAPYSPLPSAHTFSLSLESPVVAVCTTSFYHVLFTLPQCLSNLYRISGPCNSKRGARWCSG